MDSVDNGVPSKAKRIAFAVVVALSAAAFSIAERLRVPNTDTDFVPVWYGARAIVHGVNPYATFGPGLAYSTEWNLYYPMTAMVAAIPLGFLPADAASVVFIVLSAALVGYAVTKTGWERIWIFPSATFIVALRACQWSPLMAAAFLIPALGWVFSFKPNLGFAIAASTPSSRSLKVAVIGTLILTAISFALLPAWPLYWWQEVRAGVELSAPVMRTGGFLLPLALLRWKQPEARLLLLMSLVPQTTSWYELFPLLLIARTKRETQFLSLVSSAGYIAQILLLTDSDFILSTDVGRLMVAFGYLPALAVVLRRENEGELPAWMRVLGTRVRRPRRRYDLESAG